MSSLALRFQDLLQKFDKLTLRERVLILVSVLFVVLFLWKILFLDGHMRESSRLRKSIGAAEKANEELRGQEKLLLERASFDPDKENRKRFKELRQALAGLDSKFRKATSELVPPRQMPPLLEDLLRKQKGLRILRVEKPRTCSSQSPYRRGRGAGGGGKGGTDSLQAFFPDRIRRRIFRYPQVSQKYR